MLALMDSAGIPGLAIAVIRNGQVVSSKGFGERVVNDSSRVDENTVFEAASLGKPVVAYVALKLVDMGRLDLDRPLINYIELDELPADKADRITTRMVLSHTTGLQNERIGNEPLTFAFEPGERFRYSGEGYVLLQRVLEAITGEPLDRLAERLVFDPLGMTRTSFIWRAEFAANAAIGHAEFKVPQQARRPATARAPSSLQTTAHDYALFARAILKRQGLQPGTFEQMTASREAVAPGIAWGLGWALELTDSTPALFHWGDNSNTGFTAFVCLDQQKQRGVVYFANSTTGLSIVRRILAISGLSGGAAAGFMGYETYDVIARRAHSGSFDPFPGGSAAQYHFDLTRNFFSPAAEEEARTALLRRIERLQTMAPTATRSAVALLQALQLEDSVRIEAGKHLAYWTLRTSINTSDATAQRTLDEFRAAAAPAYNAVDVAIAATPRSTIDSLRMSLPALEKYALAIDQAYDAARRRPPPESAAAINTLAPQIQNWGPALFQTIMATLDLGKVNTPEGTLDFRRQMNAVRSHPDRSVRETGYRQNQAALGMHRRTFAFILTQSAEGRNALARLRGFADYPDETYSERLLTRNQVVTFLQRISDHAQVAREYETLRAERIKKVLGYTDVHPWDFAAALGATAPRFTIQQASEAVLASAEPVGASYVEELRALLDPRNGRLDLAPGPNRVDRPGFSTGLVGYPSMFYQGNYGGYIDDLVILAHEAGHAVQNMLMDREGLPTRYAWGPSYFTESFGVFAEMNVLRHLYRDERDRALKIFYLERLLDQATDLFGNGADAAFEQALYDSVSAGRRLDADAIEALMQNVGSKYSRWFGPDSERQLAWVQPLQFYYRPLYQLNYVYARALALAYLDELETDERNFAPRFSALLSHGYDAPPDTLLQRTIGMRLDDPTVVEHAVAVIAKWTQELRSLYE